MNQKEFLEKVLPFKDKVFRLAKRLLASSEEAEDATQEVLVRLHLGLRKFRGGSSFETWLYAITRNATADVVRRGRSRKRMADRFSALGEHGELLAPTDPVETLSTQRLAARVREFLVELPVRQREAVDLVDLQGLAPAEAADLLGTNRATLRTHLFRGRRALRTRLLDPASSGEDP